MSWTKVFANDEVGKVVFGDINTLINAIRQGQEVRMLLKFPDSPRQEYFTPAENLWIRGNVVYAQNVTHVSVKDEPNGDIVFQDDPYYWMIIVNTKGEIDMTRWLVGEHTSKGHTQGKVAVTWFVN